MFLMGGWRSGGGRWGKGGCGRGGGGGKAGGAAGLGVRREGGRLGYSGSVGRIFWMGWGKGRWGEVRRAGEDRSRSFFALLAVICLVAGLVACQTYLGRISRSDTEGAAMTRVRQGN